MSARPIRQKTYTIEWVHILDRTHVQRSKPMLSRGALPEIDCMTSSGFGRIPVLFATPL
jgi:hypothetical protein